MNIYFVLGSTTFQVIYHHVFKKVIWTMKTLDVYFEAMAEFKTGKQAKIFQNFAREIGTLVMTNKAYQKTR